MKKHFFLLSLCGLFLVSCSDQDFTAGNEGSVSSASGSVSRSYLTVNMVPTGQAKKALPAANSDNFRDGTLAESNVSMVRFFFFDNDNNPVPVRKKNGTSTADQGYYESYIDWYLTEKDSVEGDEDDRKETVQRKLKSTLGINVPTEYENPTKVLAVLNPNETVLSLKPAYNDSVSGPKLSELREVVYDFQTGLDDNNFVMSNSVYMDGTEIIDATKLEARHFKPTLEEAQANPVVIYVERVLARLDFTVAISPSNEDKEGEPKSVITLPDGTKIYRAYKGGYNVVGDEDGHETTENIYVKFLGWNVVSTPNKSRLVKKIFSEWPVDLFGEDLYGEDVLWNTKDYHRSFWAINPTLTAENYQFGNFYSAVDPKYKSDFPTASLSGLTIPAAGEWAISYMQENAAATAEAVASGQPTKVIIAAQLVKENGEPYELAEWAYKKYTLPALKSQFANMLNIYKEDNTGGKKKLKKIEPDDLTFKTATEREVTDDLGKYYVYAVLTEAAEEETWYMGSDEDSSELTAAQVNDQIRDAVNHVMVWGNGLTYYYFDVRHLGTVEDGTGYYGVVRNHIYASTVNKLSGLGTPVYKPEEVIYPEKPKYDDSIITTDVRILQWRYVQEDYDLTWP